jgi:hypothetical protein
VPWGGGWGGAERTLSSHPILTSDVTDEMVTFLFRGFFVVFRSFLGDSFFLSIFFTFPCISTFFTYFALASSFHLSFVFHSFSLFLPCYFTFPSLSSRSSHPDKTTNSCFFVLCLFCIQYSELSVASHCS